MLRVKSWLKKIKELIFFKAGKPLTGISAVLLWFYFFSLLYLIGYGVMLQTSSVMHSSEPVKYQCLRLANKEERILKKSEKWKFDDFFNPSSFTFGSSKLCQDLYRYFKGVYDDLQFKTLRQQYQRLRFQLNEINMKIGRIRQEYGDMLLEKIAAQPQERSILSSSATKAKEDLERLKSEKRRLKEQMQAVLHRFHLLPSFKNFEAYLKANYEEIKSRYSWAKRYWAFKLFGYAYLFLLPVFALFWLFFWMGKREQNDILQRLAATGAVATAIYMFLYLLWLIYEVIPFTFFRKIVEWLAQFDLEALFSVIGVLILVPLFWWLISITQKQKPIKQKELPKIHFVKSRRCGFCGGVVKAGERFCGICGKKLVQKCEFCEREFHFGLKFCPHCGKRV